jgi:uridine kinase
MSRLIVTVDGIDGSGKSTFADGLAAALAARRLAPGVLRIDDFRQALDWTAGDEASLYYDRYFDLSAVLELAARFAAGAETLTMPTFDGLAGVPGRARTIAAADTAVLVVEGVFIRRLVWPPETRHIYLEVPFDTGRSRVLARDVARGREPGEVDRRWRLRYQPAQERYLRECRPVETATLVLENAASGMPLLRRGKLADLPPALGSAIRSLVAPGPVTTPDESPRAPAARGAPGPARRSPRRSE